MFRWHILPGSIVVLSLASAAPTARAQTPEDWRATEEGRHQSEQKPQVSYGGVTPGTGNILPRVDELRGKPGNWVTWPGFIMLADGGSRLFIQTTGLLQFDIVKKGATEILMLKDTNVYLSNNRNPLVTTHFNTPLKRAYLKKTKKGLELRVELKQDSTSEINQITDPDGYHYLFIDFPAGSYGTAGEGTPAAAD